MLILNLLLQLITDENQFELIFNINAGNKFYFNNIKIENNNFFL